MSSISTGSADVALVEGRFDLFATAGGDLVDVGVAAATAGAVGAPRLNDFPTNTPKTNATKAIAIGQR